MTKFVHKGGLQLAVAAGAEQASTWQTHSEANLANKEPTGPTTQARLLKGKGFLAVGGLNFEKLNMKAQAAQVT